MERLKINGQLVELPEETESSPDDAMSLRDTMVIPATAFIEGNIALVGRLGGEARMVRRASGHLGLSRGSIPVVRFCSCRERDCECRESGFGTPGERDVFEHLLDRIQEGD